MSSGRFRNWGFHRELLRHCRRPAFLNQSCLARCPVHLRHLLIVLPEVPFLLSRSLLAQHQIPVGMAQQEEEARVQLQEEEAPGVTVIAQMVTMQPAFNISQELRPRGM